MTSPLRSNLLWLQCIVPATAGRSYGNPLVWACQWPSSQPLSYPLSLGKKNKSQRGQGLDYREAEEQSWCPSWSNSLWQGWSCGLVHCPVGNATDPIWRVLDYFNRISFWTPLKPQHSNPNPNPLANHLCCIDFLTPHRLLAFLGSLLPLKNWCPFMQDAPKEIWSIPYVSVAFFLV